MSNFNIFIIIGPLLAMVTLAICWLCNRPFQDSTRTQTNGTIRTNNRPVALPQRSNSTPNLAALFPHANLNAVQVRIPPAGFIKPPEDPPPPAYSEH